MDDYYGLLRQEIVDMIPAGCHDVLDVGCGKGTLGNYLKREGVARVCGIEVVEAAALEARAVLDEVVVADLERVELPFAPESFDCIICADVLEHLVDPWKAIGRLKGFMKPEGTIVASIPNVGFHRIVRDLLKGHWRYADAGVLDRTHLRFFTLEGIDELFGMNGLVIEELCRKTDCGANMKLLNLLCGNRFKEALVIQYVIRARHRQLP